MAPRCCVPYCKPQLPMDKLHRMPVGRAKAMLWLRIISAAFPNTTLDVDAFGKNNMFKLFICHRHFEKKYVRPSMRLEVDACPTLFSRDEIESGTPTKTYAEKESLERGIITSNDHIYSREHHYDHCYALPEPMTIKNFNIPENATKVDHSKQKKSPHEDHSYCKVEIVEKHTWVEMDQKTYSFPDRISEHPSNIETNSPDTGDINDTEKTGVVLRKHGKTDSNPFAEGIPDFDDYDDQDSPLQNLQGINSAPDPVYSWEKKIVEVPADDGDAVVSLEHRALSDLPAEISLYCENESSAAIKDSDQAPEYQCNECREVIIGFRYTCVQCADWDLCAACEARAAHDAHYVLRVPRERPYSEIQAVLAAVRQQILSENLFLNPVDDSMKIEIKSETDETPLDPEDPVDPETAPPPDLDQLPDPSDPLQVPDRFSEERPDSASSFTDSSEESDSDADADTVPSRKATPEVPDEPFTETEQLLISSDDSDNSDTPLIKRKRTVNETYQKVGQIQPSPSIESHHVPSSTHRRMTDVDAQQILRAAKTFLVTSDSHTIARPVALFEVSMLDQGVKSYKQKQHHPSSILIQQSQGTESTDNVVELPRTLKRRRPKTSASVLSTLTSSIGCSIDETNGNRPSVLQPSQDSTIQRTDHQRETVVALEPVEDVQEVSELLNEQPEFCLRLPPDTDEASLIQALQCTVSVRLKRDF